MMAYNLKERPLYEIQLEKEGKYALQGFIF